MSDEIVDLRSVNWVEGMFLAPDHFLRQERYVESLVLWLLHYVVPAGGLLGGGARVAPAERGAARFDPIVEVDESEDTLRVSVMQCRGLTHGGGIVDVESSRPVIAIFPKKELEGATDVGIYIVARPHEKQPDERVEDPVNPGLHVSRGFKYEVKLDIRADEAEWALLLTRLRRAARGVRFEVIPGFIPPCAFMSAHSALMQGFRQINERIGTMADHYGALHRAIVEYLAAARARLNVSQDEETLDFVGRMVMTLEACAYELLDPLQPPRRFFEQATRLVREAALFLSLSPPTQEYFRLLGEIGEVEFTSMLEQEDRAREMERKWSAHENLAAEMSKVLQGIERLERLEQALEGKYMDYRLSPSLESLNFVFDRTAGDPVLYKSVAKPARPQAVGQELTFVFAPLRLEAREPYRLILVGDRQSQFVRGDRVTVEMRINPGEGYNRAPEYKTATYELENQRNLAVDFKAPDDVVTINDIRVSLRSAQPIRSAMLYVRGRLLPGMGRPAPVPAPAPGPVGPPPARPVERPPMPPADRVPTGGVRLGGGEPPRPMPLPPPPRPQAPPSPPGPPRPAEPPTNQGPAGPPGGVPPPRKSRLS